MPVPTSEHAVVERQSLRQVAIERIRAAIIDHTLEPGEILRDEDLQNWLGMSRTPVREALNELARVGLVDMAAQRYTRVAAPDPATALFDLQTIGALLGGVTRITVPVLTADDTLTLTAVLDQIIAALNSNDTATYISLGYDLAHQLLDRCPNPVLVAATRDIIDAKIYRVSLSRIEANRDPVTLTTLYRKLRDAVLDADPIAAELAIEPIFQLTTTVHETNPA